MFADTTAARPLCPRLIDYVVVVGSREPGSRRDIKTPELLRRYPPDDHADFLLPNDIVFFCQPEGCYTIGQRCSAAARKCVNFTFTLTDKDANRVRYGICSNFYRTAERAETTLTTPSVDDGGGKPLRAKKKKLFTLTSICIVSHHAFFSTFRQVIYVLQQMINACQQRVRHVLRPRQKFLGAQLARQPLWTVLSGQITPNDTTTTNNLTTTTATNHHHNQVFHLILHEIKELETWILTLLSAPVPIPARTRVELELLPPPTTPAQRQAYDGLFTRLSTSSSGAPSWQPLMFGLPDKTRLPLVDIPIHFPFELMGIESCLRVLAIILLENKVVFQSRDFCALTQTVMSLVALLYPLEYMFPIIPLLPSCMAETEHLMLAPTPFIIGIPASFFLYKKDFVLPDDVWLVDIDANRIVPPESTMREERLRQQHLANMSTQQHHASPTTLSANNIPHQHHHHHNNNSSNNSPRNFSPIPTNLAMSPAVWPLSELPDNVGVIRELRCALTLLKLMEDQNLERAMQQYQQLSLQQHERDNLIAYLRRALEQSPVAGGIAGAEALIFDEIEVANMLATGTWADADALDVYIRCALIRYFLSDNLLADLTEHCRVMRLFPRPVVAFQLYSFIKSRPLRTVFVDRLAKTQAIEYFAEWVLSPTNLAFQRITTGVGNARAVGDKVKWFSHNNGLEAVQFVVYDKKSTLAQALVEAHQHLVSSGGSVGFGRLSLDAGGGDGPAADEGDSPLDDEDSAQKFGSNSNDDVLLLGGRRQVSIDDDEEENDDDENLYKKNDGASTSSSYSSINDFVHDVVRRRAQRKQAQRLSEANENSELTSTGAGNNLNNQQQRGGGSTARDGDDDADDAVCHGNARIKPLNHKLPLCSNELDPTKLCQPPKTLRDAAGAHAVPSPSSSMASLFSSGRDDDEQQSNNDDNDDDDDDSYSSDTTNTTDTKKHGRRRRHHRHRRRRSTVKSSSPNPVVGDPAVALTNPAQKPAPPPRPPAPLIVDNAFVSGSDSGQDALLPLTPTTTTTRTSGPSSSTSSSVATLIGGSGDSMSREPSLDSTTERRGSTRQASISSASAFSQHRSDSTVTEEAVNKIQTRVHDIADKSRLRASRLLYKLRESSKEFMHDLPNKVEKRVEQLEQKFDKFADSAITRPELLQQRSGGVAPAPPLQLPFVAPPPPPTSLQSPQSELSSLGDMPTINITQPISSSSSQHHAASSTPTSKAMFDFKSHVKKMVSDPKQQLAELRTAMDARIDQFGKDKGGIGVQTQTLLRKAVGEAVKITGHHHSSNQHLSDADASIDSNSFSGARESISSTAAVAAQQPSVLSTFSGMTGTIAATRPTTGNVIDVDQLFLREIADGVITGDGISWLKMSKLKELMKDETNRWLVVQCITKHVERLYRDDEYIEDIHVTKEQFKGLRKLSEALITGYEHTFNMWGLGGMGSVFGLLEIAYTHYYEKPMQHHQHQQQPNTRRDSNTSSIHGGDTVSVGSGGGENRLEEMATGMKSVLRSTMRNLRSQLASSAPSASAVNNMSTSSSPIPITPTNDQQQQNNARSVNAQERQGMLPVSHRMTLDIDSSDAPSPAIRLPSKSPSPNNSVDGLRDFDATYADTSNSSNRIGRSASPAGSSPATSGPDTPGDEGGGETSFERSGSSPAPGDESVTQQQKLAATARTSGSELFPPQRSPSRGNLTQQQQQQPQHQQSTKPINTVLGPAFQEAPSPYGSSPASSQPGSRRSSRSSFHTRRSGSSLVTTTSINNVPNNIHGAAVTDDSDSNSVTRRKRIIAHHTIQSQSVESNASSGNLNEQHKQQGVIQHESSQAVASGSGAAGGSNSRKSSITSGYRYQAGSVVPTADHHASAPAIELPERVYLFEILAGAIAGNTYSAAPLGFSSLKRSKIWDQLQFWEDAFIDATAHERDLVGLGDADPSELLQRYSSLRQADRKQMENDEDKVLAIMMYNLCAFMVAMRVNKAQLRRKLQRLLGKSHLGLLYNPEINNLLDQVVNLHGNDIDLKPPFSRQQRSQTFAVYLIPHADPVATSVATTPAATTLTANNNSVNNNKLGSRASAEFAIDANQLIEQTRAFQDASRSALQNAIVYGGDAGTLVSKATMNKNLMFMEVRDDGLLLKSMNGVPVQRCPYENLINMTFSPRTRVLCLWTRGDAQTLTSTGAQAPLPVTAVGNTTPAAAQQQRSSAGSNGNVSSGSSTSSAYRKPVLNNQTMLSKFYCRQCKELYTSIKAELGHAASKANGGGAGGRSSVPNKQGALDPAATWTGELGGDFPVQDQQTGEGGLLKVTMDGISLLFAESKAFVELARIRKCFTQEGGVFVLEEFDANTREISQRSFKSPMADQICYAVLCLFSYIAAGKDNSTISSTSATLVTQRAPASSSTTSSASITPGGIGATALGRAHSPAPSANY